MSINEEVGLYVISKDFVKLINNYNVATPLQVFENKALITLTPSERDDLVQRVHENQNFCAGVTDVTEEYVTSANQPTFLQNYIESQALPFAPLDVSIGHETQANSLISRVKADRFESFLKKYIEFPDRYGNSETGKAASNFLASQLSSWANEYQRTDIEVKEVVTGKSYAQNSIFARIPGTDSSLPGVLIGGHMDTLKNAKPGADDDASGTATVMEVFRSVLESGMKFKRDLYFAFYAAEEVGLVGSGVMARQFKANNIALRGVLQFDMVGFLSQEETFPMHFVEDNVSDELTMFTKELAKHYLGLTDAQLGSVNCNYECSDHASWNRQGYPSAFPFESSMKNMNHKIHTAKDTMDTVNIKHAMQFVKLGAAFVAEMAEAN